MKNFIAIAFSFFIALLLEILPLPSWIIWIRPEWSVLVLVFWLLALPNKIGITIAFFLGLFMDLLTGTLLGQHALIFVMIAYFMIRFCLQIRQFSIWQQSLMIFSLVFLYQTFEFWIWGILSGAIANWFYWLPCVTSALLWPWANPLLKRYQIRYNIGGHYLD